MRVTEIHNRFHYTSYLPEKTDVQLRSAPVCIDKVNAELPFGLDWNTY